MTVEVVPIRGLPEVVGGDDLASLLLTALDSNGIRLEERDIVVLTQKIVSKAEGRVVPEEPEGKAGWVARETRRVVARRGDLLVVETANGLVCANAGVDASNVAEGMLSLLPMDPDGTAERIRTSLGAETGLDVAVVVTDTFGRAWRQGVVNVAIGCAGLPAAVDLRGTRDAMGRVLEATVVALADEVAAASGLAMGKADGVPAALVRGVRWEGPAAPARALVRPPEEDLFRASPLEALRGGQTAARFSTRDVGEDILAEALLAARSAPIEPDEVGEEWLIVAVVPPAARAALAATAVDHRTRLAVDTAPVVMAPFVRRERAAKEAASLVAAGAAMENLLLALHAQGLAARWFPPGRFDPTSLRAALHVGSDRLAVGVVVAGWAAR